MRTIILLSSIAIAALCNAGDAEQFSFTNAAFQSKLQSMAAPKGTTVNEYLKDFRDFWEPVDSWPKGEMTNGLFCTVQILSGTTCCAYIANTTTNHVVGYLNLPFEAMLEINLFDSQGKPVAKTDSGKQFSFWTQEQIKDQLKRINPTTMRRKGYFGVPGLFYKQISNNFIIPQTFQVKQPGEYTFHLSVQLVKSEPDQSGQFLKTILPEVVAKIQVRPEDIPLANFPSNGQTNLPAK